MTLREECRLWLFQNRVLRRMFGPERDEVIGEWRRLHNQELHALRSSPNIICVRKSRKMSRTGHVARMRERRGAYRVLVGKPEGRRLLERHRRRWEGNIKMYLREVGWEDLDWIDLAQDRDRIGIGCCECGHELPCFIKCGEILHQLRTCQLL
jgi:hypothetical protein